MGMVTDPTAVASISGIHQIPTGSRVTFAAQVIRSSKGKPNPIFEVADESGSIRVEGKSLGSWKKGDSFRIENGLLQKSKSKPSRIQIDALSHIRRLDDPVFVGGNV